LACVILFPSRLPMEKTPRAAGFRPVSAPVAAAL
jgi:hypothetical protein